MLSLATKTGEISTLQAKLDSKIGMVENDFHVAHRKNVINLAHGLLMNLVIKGVRIAPTDNLEKFAKKVLDFKRQHKYELGNFRTNLTKLVKDIDKDLPLEAIQENVASIYKDEFLSALHDLQASLDSAKIKWFYENLFQMSFMTTTAPALLTAVVGLAIPQALLLAAGVSMVTKKNLL